jgi:hypothetical protein
MGRNTMVPVPSCHDSLSIKAHCEPSFRLIIARLFAAVENDVVSDIKFGDKFNADEYYSLLGFLN